MRHLIGRSSFADGDLTIHLNADGSIPPDRVSKADIKSHASGMKDA